MSVFFNGRLWTSPAVMSLVDDSAMYNKNPSVGNVLALVGKSEGGKPHTELRFGSAAEAREVLRGGELLKAVEKAFDPSSQTGGPTTVVCVRVNPAAQASLALKDAVNATAIELKSTGYGLFANGIKVKVESASVKGKKLTTQFGNAYYSADNVFRDAFSVSYSGAEPTATITVGGAEITLFAPAGSPVAVIDLASYKTIDSVVDRINSVAGFSATALDGNGSKATLNGLDYVDNVSLIASPLTVTANLQAAIDWFNGVGEGFIDAKRGAGAGSLPQNIGFTFLAGGSNGNTTMSEWQAAYDVLQSSDVQWVVPVTADAAIHAMNDAHCAFMSNIARLERRGIVGMDSGTTDDEAITAAKALNSDRTSLVHLGFYDYDDNGDLALYPGYILAAMLAGAFSGVNPGTALTNKTIKVRGLERKLRNPTDTDKLINGGVLCVEDTAKGYKVVKSITTWLANDNYNRVEVSVGVACDFVARAVRESLDDLRGAKGSPGTLSEAVSRVDSTLRELARPEPMGIGVLVGDKANPPFRGITASLDGDVLRVEFECSPVIPVNYIPVVIHAVPFSGSVSA